MTEQSFIFVGIYVIGAFISFMVLSVNGGSGWRFLTYALFWPISILVAAAKGFGAEWMESWRKLKW